MDKYLQLAKGAYQRAILLGTARLSGADLRGRARMYAGRYAKSRRNLLKRLERAGLPYHIEQRAHGRLVLVLDGALKN